MSDSYISFCIYHNKMFARESCLHACMHVSDYILIHSYLSSIVLNSNTMPPKQYINQRNQKRPNQPRNHQHSPRSSATMLSDKLTNKFTNDNDSNVNVNDEPTTSTSISTSTTLPPSPSILSSLTTLLASHATLTHSHASLHKAYLALELELRWYSDKHISAHADLQTWQAACRALEAERDALRSEHDALGADRRLALKAKRGPLGGRLWGREKMGEVWKMQGEFVWVRVEERDWGRVLGLKAAREGVERGARMVRECLGELRGKCREGRRGRSVVSVALRRVST